MPSTMRWCSMLANGFSMSSTDSTNCSTQNASATAKGRLCLMSEKMPSNVRAAFCRPKRPHTMPIKTVEFAPCTMMTRPRTHSTMAEPRLSRPASASRSRATATMLPMAETTIGTPRYHGSASSAREGNSRQLTPATGTSSMEITATCTLILLSFTSLTDETVVMGFLLDRFLAGNSIIHAASRGRLMANET